jgi:hypothetical protein
VASLWARFHHSPDVRGGPSGTIAFRVGPGWATITELPLASGCPRVLDSDGRGAAQLDAQPGASRAGTLAVGVFGVLAAEGGASSPPRAIRLPSFSWIYSGRSPLPVGAPPWRFRVVSCGRSPPSSASPRGPFSRSSEAMTRRSPGMGGIGRCTARSRSRSSRSRRGRAAASPRPWASTSWRPRPPSTRCREHRSRRR